MKVQRPGALCAVVLDVAIIRVFGPPLYKINDRGGNLDAKGLIDEWGSRFVDELPHENVEVVSETGYSGMPGGDDAFTGSIEDLGERSNYQSPGWKRLKENSAKYRSTGAPRDASDLTATSGGPEAFRKGQRVFHDKFGYGRVAFSEGNKLTVDFEKSGRKKVIATFVTLA